MNSRRTSRTHNLLGRTIALIASAFLCVVVTSAAFPSDNPAAPTDAAIQKSREIVSRHKGVFTKPPKYVPSFHGVDGPITGNGDLGLTVGGPPDRQKYYISKNDFWKSGPDFKQSGPSLIGRIDLHINALQGASYHVEQLLYEPVLRSTFTTNDNTVTIDARVFATDNVVLLEINTDKKPVEVRVDPRAKTGYGSETDSGKEADVYWFTRKFNGKNLLFPAEAKVALRLPPGDSKSFTVMPGKATTIVAAVVTNNDSSDYEALATAKVRRITPADIAQLKSDHAHWWQNYWAKSYVELDDKLLEKFYYGGHYVMACCSRNKSFPPGLYGNWTTVDRLAWAGDYHLNYNHEAPFWALYSSNRVELTDCYDTPLIEHLDEYRCDAQTYLNKNGAYASVGLGPKGLTSRFADQAGLNKAYGKRSDPASYADLAGQPMFLGQKSNAVFASMNMILRYRYTYDKAYAAHVYPFLRAVADFWDDYLVLEHGRYVIYDDGFDEVGPWQRGDWKKRYGDFNSIASLGFVRSFYGAMLEISGDLGCDEANHEHWRYIRDHLSAFPTKTVDGAIRYCACESGPSSTTKIGLDYIMLHGLVYPATNIGLSSDEATLHFIRAEMDRWTDSTWLRHGNAVQTIFIAAPRVGYDPNVLFEKAHAKIARDGYPNLWLYAGGGGIETCSAIPGMINEMMLQSHDGIVRVFPDYPAKQSGSFYRLRTFGAFLVSSSITDGAIGQIVIESERGKACKLANPWPNSAVAVSRNGKPAETFTGSLLQLTTAPGEKLVLNVKAK